MWEHIFIGLGRIFQFFLFIIIWPYSVALSWVTKPKVLPPIKDSLLFHSAYDLAGMIRTQQVKATEVLNSYIARIKEVEPVINRFEEALKEAKMVDEALKNNPDPIYWQTNKPLFGIPLSVKESIAVTGLSNNTGRVVPSERIALKDADVVTNLKNAGAIVTCVTNTPELCLFWESNNNKFGCTRNPHNSRRTAGGSSGGEAALIASAGSLIGIGSDLGGSGRIPAHFCGIFGHKPTPRIISTKGHMPDSTDENWDKFLVFAPMARNALDLELIFKAAAPGAAETLRLDEAVDFWKLKIYYLEDIHSFVAHSVNSEVKEAIQMAAFHFQSYGTNPELVKIEKFWESLNATCTIMCRMKSPQTIFFKNDDPDDWSLFEAIFELIKKIFCCSKFRAYSIFVCIVVKLMRLLPKRAEEKMKITKDNLTKNFEELLGDNGVLILPVFPNVAPKHYGMYYKLLDSVYLFIFNLLEMPATTVPICMSKQGLPIGVQIVSTKNNDRLTLAVAKELEKAFGGWMIPFSEDILEV